MDISLLNDILTSTVSGLFTNKDKHKRYLNDFTIEIQNLDEKESHKEDIATLSTKETEEKLPVEEWVRTYGKKKMYEIGRYLELDKNKIKCTDYASKTIQWRQDEKNKVKEELRQYDLYFQEYFNRMPSNAEKEVMRPVYIYYKNINKGLEMKQSQPKYNRSKSETALLELKKNFHSPTQYISDNSTHASSNKEVMRLSNLEMTKIEEEYILLKKDQVELELVIFNFRKNFVMKYGRPPEYYEELLPIEKEFNKFKVNNERMKHLKSLMSLNNV